MHEDCQCSNTNLGIIHCKCIPQIAAQCTLVDCRTFSGVSTEKSKQLFCLSFIITTLTFHSEKRKVTISVGRYHGTTVEPRYFFFTVPVPSMSWYYRGTAIPQIPRYYRTVPADK